MENCCIDTDECSSPLFQKFCIIQFESFQLDIIKLEICFFVTLDILNSETDIYRGSLWLFT